VAAIQYLPDLKHDTFDEGARPVRQRACVRTRSSRSRTLGVTQPTSRVELPVDRSADQLTRPSAVTLALRS
jgi:hypothetical protein